MANRLWEEGKSGKVDNEAEVEVGYAWLTKDNSFNVLRSCQASCTSQLELCRRGMKQPFLKEGYRIPNKVPKTWKVRRTVCDERGVTAFKCGWKRRGPSVAIQTSTWALDIKHVPRTLLLSRA